MRKIKRLQVGDTTTEFLTSVNQTLTGKVVYVHPERRFYTVEFEFEYGKFRESFTDVKYDK